MDFDEINATAKQLCDQQKVGDHLIKMATFGELATVIEDSFACEVTVYYEGRSLNARWLPGGIIQEVKFSDILVPSKQPHIPEVISILKNRVNADRYERLIAKIDASIPE